MASPWDDVEFVAIPPAPVARCPGCGWHQHQTIRTMGGCGDGAVMRRCVCLACSERFVVVVDPTLANDWQDE